LSLTVKGYLLTYLLTYLTCHGAAIGYMSQTRDQKSFTISEVGADSRELTIPRHIIGHPLPASANNWTCDASSRHTAASISHTRPPSLHSP